LGLKVVFREAYSTGILQFWHLSIDIRFILLHVEFEDGLSISVVKAKTTRRKTLQLEIVKFLKKVKRPAAYFILNPAKSNDYVTPLYLMYRWPIEYGQITINGLLDF
jgi:hypothetical protein